MEIYLHASRVLTDPVLEQKVSLSVPRAGSPDSSSIDELKGRLRNNSQVLQVPAVRAIQRGVSTKSLEKYKISNAKDLRDPRRAAWLLHQLANHELQAAEGFAYAILRWAGADETGVGCDLNLNELYGTMRDELRHFFLYRSRLQALGFEFGDFACSDWIWRVVSSAGDFMSFNARMALVFEQANLDYASAYAKMFADSGDLETAAVLRQVLEDEIRHVRSGVRYHRNFEDGAKQNGFLVDGATSNFQIHALDRLLVGSGLTARQASGPAEYFDIEARLRAGIPEDFVESLRDLALNPRKLTRVPRDWIFNPEAEWNSHILSAKTEDLLADLDSLMLLLAKEGDRVMLRRRVSGEYLDFCATVFPGVVFAEREISSDTPLDSKSSLLGRKIEFWLRTEQSFLNQKSFAAELRAKIASKDPGRSLDELNPERETLCHDRAELIQHCKSYADLTFRTKPQHGASGMGQVVFHAAKVSQQMESLSFPLWVEPELDLKNEFGIQMEVLRGGRAKIQGITHNIVSKRGAFVAASTDVDLSKLPEINLATDTVANELWQRAQYFGPASLDIFETQKGTWRIPSEVNIRWSMGRLACEARKRLFAGEPTVLYCAGAVDLKRKGVDSFAEFFSKICAEYVFASDKIIPLCDPWTAKRQLVIVMPSELVKSGYFASLGILKPFSTAHKPDSLSK